jgi:hypothetical protein
MILCNGPATSDLFAGQRNLLLTLKIMMVRLRCCRRVVESQNEASTSVQPAHVGLMLA